MARIVMKFGGTSMADHAKLQICAGIIAEQAKKGHQVAVVVSAPAGMTNDLTARIAQITGKDHRSDEADVILSSGEQINAGLLALTLRELGFKARSWTGWQAGFITDDNHGHARLSDARSHDLCKSLDDGAIAVLTGFQGVTENGRITTLGRGGSDLSAVALATAIAADRCDIYTDVEGVFTTDPRIEDKAQRIAHLSAESALEMASNGAKVLHSRSVELALSEKMPLRVLSTFVPGPGTHIDAQTELGGLETHLASGVTYSRDEARIALIGLDRKPEVTASIFKKLAQNRINVDMIVQSPARQGGKTNLVFATNRIDHGLAVQLLRKPEFAELYQSIEPVHAMAKVSVIGLGMRSQVGMAQIFFEALLDAKIIMDAMSTSELRISALIDEADIERAVRALHFAYGLDQRHS